MSDSAPPPSRKPMPMANVVIVMLILAIGAVLVYRYFQAQPGSFLAPPAEYQLQYMPADFKLDINPETALAILQKGYWKCISTRRQCSTHNTHQ